MLLLLMPARHEKDASAFAGRLVVAVDRRLFSGARRQVEVARAGSWLTRAWFEVVDISAQGGGRGHLVSMGSLGFAR
jgi:hypothetical protein